MWLKRPFVPKSDVKQWFTTTTTTAFSVTLHHLLHLPLLRRPLTSPCCMLKPFHHLVTCVPLYPLLLFISLLFNVYHLLTFLRRPLMSLHRSLTPPHRPLAPHHRPLKLLCRPLMPLHCCLMPIIVLTSLFNASPLTPHRHSLISLHHPLTPLHCPLPFDCPQQLLSSPFNVFIVYPLLFITSPSLFNASSLLLNASPRAFNASPIIALRYICGICPNWVGPIQNMLYWPNRNVSKCWANNIGQYSTHFLYWPCIVAVKEYRILYHTKVCIVLDTSFFYPADTTVKV